MSWAIVGSAAVGTASTLFSGSKKKKLELPPEFHQAMSQLSSLSKTGVDQPTRQVAGLTEAEKYIQNLGMNFAGSGTSPALTTAIGQAGDIAKGTDVTQLPEFKGTMDKILEQGRLDAQGIARGLQLRGAATGTPGRDILGRSVTGTGERLMAAATPFLESERNRRLSATGLLGSLAGQEEAGKVSRISTGAGVASMQRTIQQMINDSQFQKELAEIQFKFQTQPDILSRILGNTTGIITGGGPNDFSKFIQGFGAAGSVFGGLGGGNTQLGGQGSTVGISGSSFNNPQAVFGSP